MCIWKIHGSCLWWCRKSVHLFVHYCWLMPCRVRTMIDDRCWWEGRKRRGTPNLWFSFIVLSSSSAKTLSCSRKRTAYEHIEWVVLLLVVHATMKRHMVIRDFILLIAHVKARYKKEIHRLHSWRRWLCNDLFTRRDKSDGTTTVVQLVSTCLIFSFSPYTHPDRGERETICRMIFIVICWCYRNPEF